MKSNHIQEVFLLFVLSLSCCVNGSILFSERRVLLEFKSFVSDPYGLLSTWKDDNFTSFDDDGHCSWFGVACNSQSRVVGIRITGGNDLNSLALSCSESLKFPFTRFGIKRSCGNFVGKLGGKLTPFIGQLSQLRVLSLPFNEFSGEIPLEIWSLENLEVLDFEGNLLSGQLPAYGFVGLRKLKVMNLGFNRLDGEIPFSLLKFVDLEILNLSGNKLRGLIPRFVWSFFKLRGLYLANNEFNGSVPDISGSKCQYLEHVDLSGNFLSGKIPSALGDCRHLRTLLLFSNTLRSVIPKEIGQLRRLQVLDVSRNFIGGTIPAELGNCIELSVVVLSNLFDTWPDGRSVGRKVPFWLPNVTNKEHNHFHGSIPSEITALPKLRVLWAPMVTSGGSFPSNWGDCKSLEMLNLAQNGFTGRISGVFEQCSRLHYLDLRSNRLNGELDKKLPVPCMTVFDISHNFMSGAIPRFNYNVCPHVNSMRRALGQVYHLSYVYASFFQYKTRAAHHLPFSAANLAMIHDFGANYFTGPMLWLPVAPQRLRKQIDYAFLASGNKLTGSLSRSLLGKCGELHGMIINMSKNQISGPIPENIGSMCKCLRFLDASDNQISGSIPQSFKNLEFLVTLNLSGNKLQGQLPFSLYQLKSLKQISLHGNNLTDESPSFGKLSLSTNSLSKELSVHFHSGFSNARSLSSIILSSNDSSDLVSLNDQTYGNSYQASQETSTPVKSQGGDGFKAIEIASIASASAIVSVLLALLVIFFYTRKWAPNPRIQVSEPKEVTVFVNIGVPLLYENIVEATGNFNASNCIGNGGFGATYKAQVAPGTLVAIKKLAVGRFQGIQQFHNEIEALGQVRHANLVTLIGYHASDSEMFLIYNYLPGGNLEDFIKDRSPSAVNWKVLHKIALDIASALAYLHYQCAPKVLHRDVKPNNILLDKDLNAYLSDFGLSRLLGTSETHATTGVAGTFGYVAPEYALTCRVSEKADVYSYGVVLLELISDKKALDPSFSTHENGFNIVSWACMLLRHGQAKDVFTAGLWDSGPHDDLVEVLHLAVRCTVDSLSTRPTMKQVVQQLRRIQPR